MHRNGEYLTGIDEIRIVDLGFVCPYSSFLGFKGQSGRFICLIKGS